MKRTVEALPRKTKKQKEKRSEKGMRTILMRKVALVYRNVFGCTSIIVSLASLLAIMEDPL